MTLGLSPTVYPVVLKGMYYFCANCEPAHISCSIGYVEFRTVDLVEKALNLNGTIVMGLPMSVQYTEAERNRTHAGDG